MATKGRVCSEALDLHPLSEGSEGALLTVLSRSSHKVTGGSRSQSPTACPQPGGPLWPVHQLAARQRHSPRTCHPGHGWALRTSERLLLSSMRTYLFQRRERELRTRNIVPAQCDNDSAVRTERVSPSQDSQGRVRTATPGPTASRPVTRRTWHLSPPRPWLSHVRGLASSLRFPAR